MSYNWPEIFQNKTDEELYDIYCGKTMLSGDAKVYAEKELMARGFDFDNIEEYQKLWNLSKLRQEELFEKSDFTSNSNAYYISWKGFSLMIVPIVLLWLLISFNIFKVDNPPPNGLFIFIILLAIAFTGINNYTYNRKKKQQEKRKQKMRQLAVELNDAAPEHKKHLEAEYRRQKHKMQESMNSILKLFLISILILLLIAIYRAIQIFI